MTAPQPATPGSDSVREVWHGPDGREVMTGVHLAALGAAGWTVLPPAETQQDDERARWIDGEMAEPWHRDLVAGTIAQNAADPIAWAERVATTYGRSGSLEVTAVIWALLDQLDAARPSADTEKLLASVLRKLMAADSFLALSTHRSATGMPVQFTLDDTSIEVTDAEADAIKATVGW